MGLTIGARVGRYEITGVLGAGGMGEVYRARDPKLHRDVAVKVLAASDSPDPERLERFEREARILASLSHPHIGHIYEVEEADGFLALILEIVEGETLAERFAQAARERTRIPLRDALAIARQIADALDAAHQKGIMRWSRHDGRIYYRDNDTSESAVHKIWSIPPGDAAPRLVARVTGRRGTLGTQPPSLDRAYLYFTWREDPADVWVMDVR